MRIAMMATGGIGGFLAVRLTQAGSEVACIARGPHLQAIRENGLTLKSSKGEERVTPWRATDTPSEIGPVDVVIMGVKAGGLEAACTAILPCVSKDTLVVPFLNGVEAVDRMSEILPSQAVANGVAYISTTIVAPGVIAQVGDFSRFLFGELDNRQTPRILALQKAMTDAGITAEIPEDVTVALWTKAAFINGISGITAAARCRVKDIIDTPELSRTFRDVVAETCAVASAQGIALPDDLPDRHWDFLQTLPAEMRGSTAIDLEHGAPLEIPWLNGAITRLGAKAGVPTPVNQAITGILAPFASGKR